MNIIHKKMLIISSLLILSLTPLLALNENIAREIRKKYDADRLRILVLNFTFNSENERSVELAKIIREQFAREKVFAILNIEAINNQIASGNFKKMGYDDKVAFAVYLGKKLKAHKIVMGNIRGSGKEIQVHVEVVDVREGDVTFAKSFHDKRENIKKTAPLIARNIASGMIDIDDLMPLHLSPYYINPEVGVSGGMLYALGSLSRHLRPSFYTSINFTFISPFFTWAKIETSVAFSRLKARGIRDGNADLIFMPVTLSGIVTFALSPNLLIPRPMIKFGAGATFLSLKKEQYDADISEMGANPTLVAGTGLALMPFRNINVQVELLYHYIYENTVVTYISGGIRASIVF